MLKFCVRRHFNRRRLQSQSFARKSSGQMTFLLAWPSVFLSPIRPLFRPLCKEAGSQAVLGERWGTFWTCGQPFAGLTQKWATIHTLIHTYGLFREASWPNLRVLGLWKKTRALGTGGTCKLNPAPSRLITDANVIHRRPKTTNIVRYKVKKKRSTNYHCVTQISLMTCCYRKWFYRKSILRIALLRKIETIFKEFWQNKYEYF